MARIGDWLAMGGYAAYVWPAYGVAGAVLAALALHAWLRHRRSSAALSRLEHGEERQ